MGSGHKNGNRQRYGRRLSGIRLLLPIITIVCDDTKTAVAYFTELKREVKAKVIIQVERAPRCGASPTEVVDLAKKVPIKRKEDSVWALVDIEGQDHTQQQAQQAKEQANGSKVNVLLSMPCYEVWTLAHFIDTGEAFQDCSAVIRRIKTEWMKKFGNRFGCKKGQADYGKLMPHLDRAMENAKKRSSDQDRSWTEVYKVVQAIRSRQGGST